LPAGIVPVGTFHQTAHLIRALVDNEFNQADSIFPPDLCIASVVSDRGLNYSNAASAIGGGDNASTEYVRQRICVVISVVSV